MTEPERAALAGGDLAPAIRQAEANRKMIRDAVFGDSQNNINIAKSMSIVDGDYSFSSSSLSQTNKGS